MKRSEKRDHTACTIVPWKNTVNHVSVPQSEYEPPRYGTTFPSRLGWFHEQIIFSHVRAYARSYFKVILIDHVL